MGVNSCPTLVPNKFGLLGMRGIFLKSHKIKNNAVKNTSMTGSENVTNNYLKNSVQSRQFKNPKY